ncbi:MAG: thiol-disulfide oxidoreductase DCC family protein [Bacteroidia bacterium]
MEKSPLLFYDGICGLCNRSVQFVIRHDKKRTFRFIPLQSDEAKKFLSLKLPANSKLSQRSDISSDTLILLDNEKIFYRSTAVLKIFKQLGGVWQLFYIFIFIPEFLRDAVYNFIARNRYRWFGKENECRFYS